MLTAYSQGWEEVERRRRENSGKVKVSEEMGDGQKPQRKRAI